MSGKPTCKQAVDAAIKGIIPQSSDLLAQYYENTVRNYQSHVEPPTPARGVPQNPFRSELLAATVAVLAAERAILKGQYITDKRTERDVTGTFTSFRIDPSCPKLPKKAGDFSTGSRIL